jgi:hypothetical protein
MKHKTLKKKVLSMGGKMTKTGLMDFPKTLRIKNKKEAIKIIDIMRYCNDLEDGPVEYALSLDTPLEALKAAIKRGVL